MPSWCNSLSLLVVVLITSWHTNRIMASEAMIWTDSTLKITPLGAPLILNEPYDTPIISDHEGNVWLLSKSTLWTFTVDSLKWKRCCKVTLPDSELVMGYDHAKKRFLFWSTGVGKVYTMQPGDSVLTRIDKSFHHRTQFGHLGIVHPKTGSIIAFGGYGYWESRNITTKFDPITSEWQIITLNSGLKLPEARMYARGIFDLKREQLHIFSGNSFYENRQNLSSNPLQFNDYWILDLKNYTWNQKKILRNDSLFEYYYTQNQKFNLYNTYNGTIDTLNDLAWYTIRQKKNNNRITLLAFDLKEGFGSVMPFWLGDIGNKSIIKYLYYHSQSKRLMIVWEPRVNNQQVHYVYVSAIALPQPERVRAYLNETKFWTQWKYWIPSLVIIALGGALSWLGFYVFKRQKIEQPGLKQDIRGTSSAFEHPTTRTKFANVTTPQHKVIRLQVQFVEKPVIQSNGKILNNLLTTQELHILIWLIWSAKIGRNYVLTDVIENLFWNKNPNLDYVRKQRNLVLKKIDEKLRQLFEPDFQASKWILDRIPIDDRRKREYAFNLEQAEIQSDLDHLIQLFLNRTEDRIQKEVLTEEEIWISTGRILSDITQPWALEIRTWLSRQYQQYRLDHPSMN